MAEASAGPVSELIHGLKGSRPINLSTQEVAPDGAEDFDIDDVRCCEVWIGAPTRPNALRVWAVEQYAVEAGRVNNQHSATGRGFRQAPR